MITIDIERAKNDIIYFTEQFFGIKLKKWQKEVLIAIQNGQSVHIDERRSEKRILANSIKEWIKFKGDFNNETS